MDTNAPEVTDEFSSNIFLAMWDSTGLECLIDLSDHFKKQTWAALAGEPPPRDPVNLDALKLRARFNSQRVYEIYIFSTNKDIGYEDIREIFENDPQWLVEWIRIHGNKIYSDRKLRTTVKIS